MNYLKTILFVIFLITVSTLLAQAPWTRIAPTPQENTINDITRIPGTNRLMAVCEGSTIIMSDDDGETWDIMLNPAGMNNQYVCKGIHFINGTTGFINGGNESILKTTDSGQTWDLKYQGSTSTWYCINDLEFCTDTHGFAVGEYGRLLETTDTGETWSPVSSSTTTDLRMIVFADSLTGFIFTWSTECLKTTNGGATWTLEPLSPQIADGNLNDCYFVNDSTGFVYIFTGSPTADGCIFKTTDSGNNWLQVHTESLGYSGKFAFLDEQHGIMSYRTYGYQTEFLETENGGTTWNVIEETWLPSGANYGMIYTNQNNILSTGLYGMMYMSNDGGLSWQPKHNIVFSGEIFKAQFLNEDIGYVLADAESNGVVGIRRRIKKTVDGGNNWNYIYANYWDTALDFYFLTADTGFSVTNSLYNIITLLKTTDGGENWTEISTDIEFNPYDIKFIDENNGIICGAYTVLKTSDGGHTWEDVTPGNNFLAEGYKIRYRSADEVFMAGSENYLATTIFHSTDGGYNWQTISIGNFGPAKDIALPDENTILIITGTEIFKSGDNGLTWYQSTLANPNPIEINALHFASPTTGYAMGSGEFSNMMKTTDGGDNWFPLETKVTSWLTAACFFNDEEGLVFGDKGVMIRTTTGGVTGTHDQAITDTGSYFTATPNPFSDEIIIRPVDGNKVFYPVEIVLMNASGRQIMEKRITDEGNDIRISGIGLKPGIYICRISNLKGLVETLKLVKIK
ncbi:MAG: YCF48-related protein [Bacteroidota bacterium]